MKTWILALCITLPAAALAHQQSGDQKNAEELLRSADRAVGYIVHSARESRDPAFFISKEDVEPFWQALKKLNVAIDKAQRGLFLQDETFFASLWSATSALEEVKVTFVMSKAKDATIEEGIEKADAALSLLRENYSKEASRWKQGGSLSAEEAKTLDTIKAKQAELQRKLAELEGKAGANKTLIDGIRETRRKSREISSSRHDVRGWVFAIHNMHIINGWLWGWHWWWGPWGDWVPGFGIWVTDVYVDVVDVIDYDWALADTYVDTAEIDMDVDLDVAMDDVELDDANHYLEDMPFEVTREEMLDFSADELEFEGPMDVLPMDSFEDFGFGDFEFDDIPY